MKKFTFLLSLLGLSASSAFAGVFVPSTDGNTHVYAIKNASQTKYYCSVRGNNIGQTTDKSSVAYFKIVESETTNQYYVLCLNNNKYVTYSEAKRGYNKVSFTDSKENAKLWKINLEAGQKERYDIFPSTVSGTDEDPSWNWVGGADYNSDLSLWDAKDGSSSWTFEECRQNLTLNYTWNGTDIVKKETVVAALPGADKSIAPATGTEYAIVGSMSPETIDASTTEYTINLAEDLPFQKSTSFADATWYVMDVHGNHNELPNGKQYVWTYQTDNSIKFPRTNLGTATYTDNMLWCFMGDVQHGFKIYNKAAGESLTLRKATDGETLASMSAQNDRNVFKLHHSTQGELREKGFCFKIDGDSYYLNAPGSNDNKTLKGWTSPDGGSTSRVFNPASCATNYTNMWLNAFEGGAITGKEAYLNNSENITALKNALNTINESASLENINKLTTLNAAIENTTATFKEGYYRLVNRQYNKFLHVNNNNMNAQVGKDKAVGSVVYFKSAGEGQYNLMMEGLYLGAVSKGQNIALGNEASEGTYTIEFFANNPIVKIHESTNSKKENDFHYIHIDGSSNAVGWQAGEGNVPSHWYVYPATDIEVALNTVGEKSYATAYLPFGVSAVSGADAYVGKLNTEKNALDMTEVEGVPAEKGFVLVGTGDKATLTIGDANEVNTDLTGTNTAITLTDENRANYLVFGKNKADNTKVGFFKTTATTIPANKAFLETSALTQEAIAMNFGGNTTGVNTVVLGENGVNAPVFDLSGRRVVAPVKGGVYIQNGKKFIK